MCFLKKMCFNTGFKDKEKNIILIEVWSVLNQLKSLIIYNNKNNNDDDNKTVRALKFNKEPFYSHTNQHCVVPITMLHIPVISDYLMNIIHYMNMLKFRDVSSGRYYLIR